MKRGGRRVARAVALVVRGDRNYDLPEPRAAFRLRVSVDDSADPDAVAKALQDEVDRAVGKVPGLRPQPGPLVSLLSGAGEGSQDSSVSYHVATLTDQYRVQHELRRRVLERLQRENIAMRASAQVA